MPLRPSELVVVCWRAVAVAVALMRPLPARNRLGVCRGAVLLAGAVALCSRLPSGEPTELVRNIAPALFVLTAYRVSAGYFVAPQPDLEALLMRVDCRLLPWLTRRLRGGRWSRWTMDVLEASYFAVYAVLPLGAWASWARGGVASVDRYWTLVFLAEGTSYLALAWLQTRPPRALEDAGLHASRGSIARVLNEFVLRHGSIQVNTLPSGHAAGATAVVLALASQGVPTAPLFGAAAVAICVATVVGRYHYLVDTVAGVLVATGWWLVLRASLDA